MIADYKIESDIDRKLLLGVLVRDYHLRKQQGRAASGPGAQNFAAASSTTEIQLEDIYVLENSITPDPTMQLSGMEPPNPLQTSAKRP